MKKKLQEYLLEVRNTLKGQIQAYSDIREGRYLEERAEDYAKHGPLAFDGLHQYVRTVTYWREKGFPSRAIKNLIKSENQLRKSRGELISIWGSIENLYQKFAEGNIYEEQRKKLRREIQHIFPTIFEEINQGEKQNENNR